MSIPGGTGFESHIYSGAKADTENLGIQCTAVAAYLRDAGFVDQKADLCLKGNNNAGSFAGKPFIDHKIDAASLKNPALMVWREQYRVWQLPWGSGQKSARPAHLKKPAQRL